MNELLEKEQIISIVPKKLEDANKGKITQVEPKSFKVEVFKNPEGIVLGHMLEFYSKTKNGVLFFNSSVNNIDGKFLTVNIPRKHRFLQRRAFSRIDFNEEVTGKIGDKTFLLTIIDLSAGGMKFLSNDVIDLNSRIEVEIPLFAGKLIKCELEPIRISKGNAGKYVLSGRFNSLSNNEVMTLTQFCMRKDIERASKK